MTGGELQGSRKRLLASSGLECSRLTGTYQMEDRLMPKRDRESKGFLKGHTPENRLRFADYEQRLRSMKKPIRDYA